MIRLNPVRARIDRGLPGRRIIRRAQAVDIDFRMRLLGDSDDLRREILGIVGEHIGVLTKVEYEMVGEMAERIIERYTREEIDSVYIVYNEFKSVIAQRLVVEKILPIEEVGKAGIAQSDEMTQEEKDILSHRSKAVRELIRKYLSQR